MLSAFIAYIEFLDLTKSIRVFILWFNFLRVPISLNVTLKLNEETLKIIKLPWFVTVGELGHFFLKKKLVSLLHTNPFFFFCQIIPTVRNRVHAIYSYIHYCMPKGCSYFTIAHNFCKSLKSWTKYGNEKWLAHNIWRIYSILKFYILENIALSFNQTQVFSMMIAVQGIWWSSSE